MKRNIKYISIGESRRFYNFGNPFMETEREASIHEIKNGEKFIRFYKGVSEASILRLAKIQEKLAG